MTKIYCENCDYFVSKRPTKFGWSWPEECLSPMKRPTKFGWSWPEECLSPMNVKDTYKAPLDIRPHKPSGRNCLNDCDWFSPEKHNLKIDLTERMWFVLLIGFLGIGLSVAILWGFIEILKGLL
jgi:hypothetical protein